jgi:hypothetical protein
MNIEKYSMGIGDRFGHQGVAQLRALVQAQELGIPIVPVWNKSFREHSIIGTSPGDVRLEADAAVKELGWAGSYYVDADHIGLKNVDQFIESSDFFTLDVADFIGKPADKAALDAFVRKYSTLAGSLTIPGIDHTIEISQEQIRAIAAQYLRGVQEATAIFRHIESINGAGTFITEVSMDETDTPQTPVEMLFILAAIADEGIPVQTIAPKFTGRFNKGVDYVGDVARFTQEFEEDLAVIAYAIQAFGLPENLKLSIHSGSDKFAIYGPIGAALKKFDAGVHLKTAGTTWLEELIGLAESGGDGLVIAKEIYEKALARYDELCGPYATVIDIDTDQLPSLHTVSEWHGEQYARALRHDQECPEYNPHFRQLLHVGYKIAAEMGDRYPDALKENEATISEHVAANIFNRHICRLVNG